MNDWVIATSIFMTVGMPSCAGAFAYWDLGRRKNKVSDGEAILSREIANLRAELHESQTVYGNRLTEANLRITALERSLKDALGSRTPKPVTHIMPFGSKQQR